MQLRLLTTRDPSFKTPSACSKVVNPQNQPVRLYNHDMTDITDKIEQDDEGFITAKMPLITAGATKNDLRITF